MWINVLSNVHGVFFQTKFCLHLLAGSCERYGDYLICSLVYVKGKLSRKLPAGDQLSFARLGHRGNKSALPSKTLEYSVLYGGSAKAKRKSNLPLTLPM
jgi:hypothetical protein